MLGAGLARVIGVQFRTNIGSFSRDMSSGGRDVKKFARDVQDASTQAKQLYGGVGRLTTAVGVGLSAALVFGGGAAISFERKMANVATISDYVRDNTTAAGDAVLDMSRKLGVGAGDLASGLYDVASSGFAGADGLTVLNAAGTDARAGLSNTATAARGLTAVLNAYGLTAADAGDVSDVMFQTVNLGVVTFDELAGTVGDFVGLGSQAGVQFDELGAAIATMTLSGVSAAEAGTSLNRVLQALIDPSDELKSQLAGMGYESGKAALDALGLKGVIDLLRESTGGQVEELIKLFPEIRAARGALALMSGDGANYERVFAGVADETVRAGAAQKALEIQSRSLGFQIDQAKASVGAMAIEFGRALLPVLRPLVALITSVADAFSALPGPVKTVATLTTVLIAGITLLGGAYLIAAPRIAAMRAEFTLLQAQAPAVAGALGIVQSAMGPLMLAITAATVIWTLHVREEKKVTAQKLALADALKAERDGVEDATKAWAVDQLVKSGAADVAKRLGLSLDDMVGSILGNEEAAARLKSALEAIVNSPAFKKDLSKSTDFFGSDSQRMKDVEKIAGELGVAFDGVNYAAGNTSGTLVNQGGILGDLTGQYNDAVEADKKKTAAELEKQGVIDRTNAATGEQRKQLAQLGAATTGAATADDKLTEAQKALGKALESFVDQGSAARDSILGLTGPASDALASFNEKGKASLHSVSRELHKSVDATLQWERDYATVVRRAGPEVASAIKDMGDDGIALMHAMATGSQREVDKITAEFKRLPDETEQSLAEFTRILEKQVADQAAWAANLGKLAAAGRGDLAIQLAQLGPEGASIVAKAAGSIGTAAGNALLDRLTNAYRTAIPESGRELETQLLVTQEIARTHGNATAEQIATSIGRTVTEVNDALGELGSVLDALPRNTVLRLEIAGQEEAQRELNKFRQQIGATGGSATITFVPPSGGRARADETRADGGLRLPGQATIRPEGTLIQWAEPGTGGEAFIPMSPMKRGRSTAILKAVAEQFGMAVVPAAAGGTTVPTFTSASKVYSDLMSRLEAAAQDKAQKQADAWNTAHPKAKTQRTVDDYYVAPHVDIKTFQAELAKSVAVQERWRKNLARIARTAGDDVAQALADMGEEGVPLVEKFAHATGAQLKALTRELRKIAPAARSALASYADELHVGVKEQQQFEADLVKLVKTGHAALAAQLGEMGVEQGGAIAHQAAGANKAQLAGIEKDLKAQGGLAGPQLTDALKLIGVLTGQKNIGLRGLAAGSGMDIPTVLTLLDRFKDLFSKVPAGSMTALRADLAAIARGEQPRAYAQGGIEWHGPQVAYSPRQWAEPETGGEAYLPLGRSKRAGTVALMHQLAGGFGYRLIPAGSRGGTYIAAGALKVEVDARGNPDADAIGEQVGATVGAAFDRLVDRLQAGSGSR